MRDRMKSFFHILQKVIFIDNGGDAGYSVKKKKESNLLKKVFWRTKKRGGKANG